MQVWYRSATFTSDINVSKTLNIFIGEEEGLIFGLRPDGYGIPSAWQFCIKELLLVQLLKLRLQEHSR
jgi:hypothetical protein